MRSNSKKPNEHVNGDGLDIPSNCVINNFIMALQHVKHIRHVKFRQLNVQELIIEMRNPNVT